MDVIANYDKQCRDCKGKSQVVLDHSSGDLVCTGCGLVLEERCFDAGMEWRDFSRDEIQSGSRGSSRQRADITTSYNMFEEAKFGTSMTGSGAAGLSKIMLKVESNALAAATAVNATAKGTKRPAPEGGEAGASKKAEAMVAVEKDDVFDPTSKTGKLIRSLTPKCRDVAQRLTLGESVVNRCTAILQDLAQKGALGKTHRIPFYCAVIHLASREESATRSVRELAMANVDATVKTSRGVSTKAGEDQLGARAASAERLEAQIEAAVKEISAKLGMTKPVAHVQDEVHMQRLVARCDLPPSVSSYALRVAQAAYRQSSLLGKSVARIAQDAMMATAIFIAAWLLDVQPKPSLQKVAKISTLNEANVRAAYATVLPALGYLVPRDMPIRLPGGLSALPPAR